MASLIFIIDRYLEIEDHFQVTFLIRIEYTEIEKTIFEILILANKLWSTGYSHWTINGPQENKDLVFECILNNTNDNQPLKWAHLEFENKNDTPF